MVPEDTGPHDIRERTAALIARLPHVKEFAEWSKRLDDAQTGDEVLSVAEHVVYMVNLYAVYRGVYIPSRQPFDWIPQP